MTQTPQKRFPCMNCRKLYCSATNMLCNGCRDEHRDMLKRQFPEEIQDAILRVFTRNTEKATLRAMLIAANDVALERLCERLRETKVLSETEITATCLHLASKLQLDLDAIGLPCVDRKLTPIEEWPDEDFEGISVDGPSLLPDDTGGQS